MSAKVRLIGPGSGVEATVHSPTDLGHEQLPGLVVYSHKLETGTPLLRFFADDTGNVDQNVNASGAGTLTGIHNGGDSVLFTANAEVGTWDFASTTQANSGTQSIALGGSSADIASFTNASDLTVTDYSSLRGFIYITSWPNNGNKNVQIQLYLNGAAVGNSVNLSTYVDTAVQDSWQLFTIPMLDFGVTTAQFDAVWLTMVDSGAGSAPAGFLDDLSLVGAGTGGSKDFIVKPPVDETWVVTRMKWTAVATSSALKYEEWFGIPGLTNGYTVSFRSKGKSQLNFTARNFFEMAQYPNVTLDIISGTNSLFEVYFDIPEEQQVLLGNLEQEIVLTVRDDLSSMVRFRASMQGYRRQII